MSQENIKFIGTIDSTNTAEWECLSCGDIIISRVKPACENCNPVPRRLSDTDRDFLLDLLESNAEPNEALKRAAERYKEKF